MKYLILIGNFLRLNAMSKRKHSDAHVWRSRLTLTGNISFIVFRVLVGDSWDWKDYSTMVTNTVYLYISIYILWARKSNRNYRFLFQVSTSNIYYKNHNHADLLVSSSNKFPTKILLLFQPHNYAHFNQIASAQFFFFNQISTTRNEGFIDKSKQII